VSLRVGMLGAVGDEEPRLEQAPAAYKPIGPIIQSQVDAGSVVARILTVKG